MKGKVINRIKLEMDALPENERLARSCISAFISRADPNVEELSDIRTVLSEAVTNAVIHGYAGIEGGKVTVSAVLYSDRRIMMKVKDCGCGIADVKLAMQPLYTTDPSGERGGMGFAIMESFCNKLTVRSRPGKGTIITMIKQLENESEKESTI